MAIHRLNPALLRTLVKPGAYHDGQGLYLRVRGPDQRAWTFRFMVKGKARWMGLGAYPAVSMAQAREAVAEARKLVKAGQDPIEVKRAENSTRDAATAQARAAAQAEAMTFAKASAEYIAAHEAGWRNAKHRQQWENTLATYAYPKIGDLAVAMVGTDHVLAVLEPIWREKPETAGRVRGRIEAVLDYAKVRRWRSGENPARWRGNLKHLLPAQARIATVEHHAALPWREINAFLASLDDHEAVAARAFRFLILTATRTSEALNAVWGEIGLDGPDGPLWTIPAARMKGGREHRVPLSEAALATLRDMAPLRAHDGPDAAVFPGQRRGMPMSNMALLMLLRRMKRTDLTAHGFRSTFRDWVAEATSYQREIAEAALAHVLGDKTEAAYQRGDLLEKRRRLMNDWAQFCADPAPAGRVVSLRPVAA